jgi:hypothetical protein
MEEEDEKEMKTEAEDTEMTNEELEELLKELEEGEDLLNDPKTTSTAHGNIAEEEESEEKEGEEGEKEEEEGKEGEEEEEEVEIDLEDMSEEDLQKFIEESHKGHKRMLDVAGFQQRPAPPPRTVSAKKEIKEAEEATNKAHEEVVDVAIISKGVNRKKLGDVARDLEKATYLVAESCESTEEAEIKFKESQKRKWN